jgi:hypothetical protein
LPIFYIVLTFFEHFICKLTINDGIFLSEKYGGK